MSDQISIRKKVLLSICILSIFILSALILAFYFMTYRSIKKFELENASINIQRFVHEISGIKSNLSSQCNDWAAWDDTYNFIEDKNQEYIDNNLNDQTIINLKTNIIVYLNNESEVVHASFMNPVSMKNQSFPDDLLKMILKERGLIKHQDIEGYAESFFLYSGMPVLLVSRPIKRSDFSGPIKGAMIFGKIFTETAVAELGKKLKLDISVLSEMMANQDETIKLEIDNNKSSETTLVSVKDRGKINAYIVENDSFGNESFAFQVSLPRDFARKSLSDALVYLILLVSCVISCIVVVVLIIDRSVLSPLFRLGKSARMVAEAGDFSLRIETARGREFGMLSRALNEMLDSLEKYHARHMQDRESLIENEAYLAKLLDSIDCGIIAAEAAGGRIINVNKACIEMSGYPKEELLDRVYTDLIVDAECDAPSETGECKSLISCEGILHRKNASSLPVLKSSVPIKRKGRVSVIITFVDISVLKATEGILKNSEKKYREFFEQDLTGNFISDLDGKILDCNIAFAKIFGFGSVDEIKSINSNELYFIPESRVHLLEAIKRERFISGIKWTMKKRNGDALYLIGNVMGIFDEKDNLTHIRGYLFDDTERIMLEKALRQAYKMEAIGTLAGGIAHDFNNILSAIMGHAELTLITAGNDTVISERLSKIIDSTKRAKGLVKQILTFSSRKDTEHHNIEMALAVKEALHILKSSVPSKIQIRSDFESISSVKADPNQVHQIVLNICINAIDAMRDRQAGLLEISIEDVYLEPENEIMLKYGHYVRLTVSDTGLGMTADVAERVFDPFFTTKNKYGNTGMGLSVVHGIVKSLDGAIRVESEPGEGSVFEVYLPRSEDQKPEPENFTEEAEMINLYKNFIGDERDRNILSAVSGPEEDLWADDKETKANKMKVLVVEDEAIILEMLSEMIKNMGYIPIPKLNPLEALDSFRSGPESVDIVMTDLSMPEMNGDRLAEEIFNISPDTPVIICSGFAGKKYAEESKLKGLRVFLKKPIVSGVLAKTLNELQEYVEKLGRGDSD